MRVVCETPIKDAATGEGEVMARLTNHKHTAESSAKHRKVLREKAVVERKKRVVVVTIHELGGDALDQINIFTENPKSTAKGIRTDIEANFWTDEEAFDEFLAGGMKFE